MIIADHQGASQALTQIWRGNIRTGSHRGWDLANRWSMRMIALTKSETIGRNWKSISTPLAHHLSQPSSRKMVSAWVTIYRIWALSSRWRMANFGRSGSWLSSPWPLASLPKWHSSHMEAPFIVMTSTWPRWEPLDLRQHASLGLHGHHFKKW